MKKTVWLIIIVLVAIDQFSKSLIKNKSLMLNSWLGLKYAVNPKAVFGLIEIPALLLIIISVIALIILLVYFLKRQTYKLPFVLFISGITGNLIDRLAFGYVRDFIIISVWPVFNLADAYLTIGVCLALYYSFFSQEKLFKQGSS
ncbi:signal peptidase II [archaeon]|nr:signal peptidase II [archaeon]